MNFRILNYFLTVAREQNITRAAEILHITQPTLSRQLMQMEEDLGVKLFDREQHKLVLTPAGSLLVHRAQEIINLVEKTTMDLQSQEEIVGNISIGAGEMEIVNLLSKILKGFQGEYPATTFDLFTNTSDAIMENMEKGLIDVAVLLAPIDVVNYRFIKIPNFETFGVLMRYDSPLAKKETVEASDLTGQSMLLPTRLTVRSGIFNWLSGNIANINIIGTSNLLGNTQVLVYNNNQCAITVRPSFIDSKYIAFRPLNPPIHADVYLAWHKDARLTPTVQKFIEYAREYINNAF